jgi:hypothetical protein
MQFGEDGSGVLSFGYEPYPLASLKHGSVGEFIYSLEIRRLEFHYVTLH